MEYVCIVCKLSLNAGENANHSCFNVNSNCVCSFKIQTNAISVNPSVPMVPTDTRDLGYLPYIQSLEHFMNLIESFCI